MAKSVVDDPSFDCDVRIGWQVEHVAIEKVAQVFNEVAHGYHSHRTIVVVNQRDVPEALLIELPQSIKREGA